MKKAISVFITVLLIFVHLPKTVYAESAYIKKVVSVVYDDSGSMCSDGETSWGYANYAMQYFCGALNDGDQLFITYMSDYKNPNVPSGFDSNRQSAIDDIRQHAEASGTPFEAIEAAYGAFNRVTEYDDNTQFWLVVISDGNFYNNNNEVSAGQLDDKLLEISGRHTPNGSRPLIQFLAIGSEITKPTERPDNNIFVEDAKDSNEIVNVLSGIADKVSGRCKVDYKLVGSDTVEFTSDIPLINIAVTLHKENADINEITMDGMPLNVVSVYKLNPPVGAPDWNKDGIKDLKGTLAMINNGENNIPAGTCRITFAKDISEDNIDILIEPALELRLDLYKGDELITVTSQLYEDETIDIECGLYEMGTDNRIDPSLLPGSAEFLLTVSEDGTQTVSETSQHITGYVLHQAETEIKAELDIENIAPVTASVAFTPMPKPVYGLTAVSPSDITIAKPDLSDNDQGLHFMMTVDGQPANPQQAAGHNIEVTSNNGSLNYNIEQLDDGSFVVTPEHSSFFLMFVPTGKTDVTAELDGEYTAQGTVNLTNGSPWTYIRNTLYWLLPLLLLLWLLSVKHFMPCAIRCERVEFDRRGGVLEKTVSIHDVDGRTDFFGSPIAKTNPRFLAYIFRESMDSFNGLQFKTGGGSKIILPFFFLRRGKIVEVIGSSLADKIVSFGSARRMTDEEYEIEYARLQETEPRSKKASFNEPLTNRMMYVMLNKDDRAMFVYTITKSN